MDDPYDLERFIEAQEPVIEFVRDELSQGQKRSHWIWFIFPQMKGLGSSDYSRHFGIGCIAEAKAYYGHPVLGARLRESTQLVLAIEDRRIDQIFSYPDDLKFRSSMTLFAHAAPQDLLFQQALQKYFAGDQDEQTIAFLRKT